jgi:hypothetical protein
MARYFSIGFTLHRTLIRALDSSKNSKYGAAGAPDWDSVHLQSSPAKTTFACYPEWVGTYYGTTTEAVESNSPASLPE